MEHNANETFIQDSINIIKCLRKEKCFECVCVCLNMITHLKMISNLNDCLNTDLALDNNRVWWSYCELCGGLGSPSESSKCRKILSVEENFSIRR